MNAWYETLNKPPFNPPGWIFTPVWTVLYTLILISIFVYYRQTDKKWMVPTTLILVIHLASNFIWTWLFFGLRSPALAFLDILLLDLSLCVLMNLFAKSSLVAAALLIPYLIWVLFATYLNLAFWILN
jgi:translocator protein